MTRPKYAKPDANQTQLVDDMRDLGMVVWVTASLPTPVLDLIGFWRGNIRIIEVKPPGLEDALNDNERDSIAALAGVGVKVIIATCVEDVIRAFEEAPPTDHHYFVGGQWEDEPPEM